MPPTPEHDLPAPKPIRDGLLTRRQADVTAHVAYGYSATDTALVLGISKYTVRKYIRQAARKIPGQGPPIVRLTRWYMTQLARHGGQI